MQFWHRRWLGAATRTGGRLALGLALTLTLLPLGALSAQAAPTPALDDQEQAFLTLINNYRASQGKPALSVSNTLTYAAKVWSLTLAAYPTLGATHQAQTTSGLSTTVTRIQQANYTQMPIAENVAAGTCCNALEKAQDVFDGWKNSPGHNMNMLGDSYRAIGISRARSSAGGWAWTTTFGGVVDSAQPPATPATALSVLTQSNPAQTQPQTLQTQPYISPYNPYAATQTTAQSPYPQTAVQNPYAQAVPNPLLQTAAVQNPYALAGSPVTGAVAAGTYPGYPAGYAPVGSQVGAIPGTMVQGVPGYDPNALGGYVTVPGGTFDPTQGGVFGAPPGYAVGAPGAGMPGMVGVPGAGGLPAGLAAGPMGAAGPGGPSSVTNSNPYANPTVNQGQPMQLNPGAPTAAASPGAAVTPTGLAPGSAATPNRPTAALTAVSDPSSLFAAGSKAAMYSAPLTPAGTLFGPLVMGNSNGWNSLLTVQNPSGSAASYTVTVWDNQGKAQATFSASTPPNGTSTFNLGSQLPAGFVGSVSVDGPTPVVGVITQDRAGSNGYVAPLVATGGQTLYAPLVFGGYNGWNSQIAVQNLDQQPAKVTIAYTAAGNGSVTSEQEVTIPAYSTRVYNVGSGGVVQGGFNGSAVIRSTNGKPIAAVVAAQHTNGLSQSYVALLGGSQSASVPLLFKNRNGWSTGIQVQNAGTAAANVSVTYASSDGTGTWTEQATVQPGGVTTFYQPSNGALPDGFVGSATINADGSPVAVLVNGVNYTGNLATTYTAAGADGGSATRIYAPLLFKGASGLNTGVQVQASGGAASVTVTYYDANGQTVATQQETIPAGQARSFYQPSVTNLPDGFKGSAVIAASGGQSISAIVNQVRY